MSFPKGGISPEKFYGVTNPTQDKIEDILKKQPLERLNSPKFMRSLLGPSKTWKIFKKQQDAIEFCIHRRNDLMCFAFEDINRRRMFLVAHPKVFWSHNMHRFFKNCSSYEIIREHSPCKLYLDIEFEYAYNEKCDGNKMIHNILKIINYNLHSFFNITCSSENILNLDSSSETKFSHHIIYQIDKTSFQDNYAVGNFVKKICGELREAYEDLPHSEEKLIKIMSKYKLNRSEVVEMFVNDRKNNKKLFIDEGVYTKNRHFRILGSSKLDKKIPLIISKSNQYKPITPKESYECDIFLDSLVTYFSWNIDRVLECDDSNHKKKNKFIPGQKITKKVEITDSFRNTQIDSFIMNLISPNGSVRRKFFFSDSSTIVYDIQGYRYCEHIQREHKSNNIKLIVDLQILGFYQKCYDPDCADFRSNYKPLPKEISFLFEDDSFLNDNSTECDFTEFPDDFFLSAIQKIENEIDFQMDNSISDEDLDRLVESTEALTDVKW